MTKLDKLKEERKQHNEHIMKITRSGKKWDAEDNEIIKKLNEVHQRILMIELQDPDTLKVRIGYSVCGWSDRHGYFRNKNFISENLKEARAHLDQLKKNEAWGIPTAIVQETFLRSSSFASDDFDTIDIEKLGPSDDQKLLYKHMCGNKKCRWEDLLEIYPFTY